MPFKTPEPLAAHDNEQQKFGKDGGQPIGKDGGPPHIKIPCRKYMICAVCTTCVLIFVFLAFFVTSIALWAGIKVDIMSVSVANASFCNEIWDVQVKARVYNPSIGNPDVQLAQAKYYDNHGTELAEVVPPYPIIKRAGKDKYIVMNLRVKINDPERTGKAISAGIDIAHMKVHAVAKISDMSGDVGIPVQFSHAANFPISLVQMTSGPLRKGSDIHTGAKAFNAKLTTFEILPSMDVQAGGMLVGVAVQLSGLPALEVHLPKLNIQVLQQKQGGGAGAILADVEQEKWSTHNSEVDGQGWGLVHAKVDLNTTGLSGLMSKLTDNNKMTLDQAIHSPRSKRKITLVLRGDPKLHHDKCALQRVLSWVAMPIVQDVGTILSEQQALIDAEKQHFLKMLKGMGLNQPESSNSSTKILVADGAMASPEASSLLQSVKDVSMDDVDAKSFGNKIQVSLTLPKFKGERGDGRKGGVSQTDVPPISLNFQLGPGGGNAWGHDAVAVQSHFRGAILGALVGGQHDKAFDVDATPFASGPPGVDVSLDAASVRSLLAGSYLAWLTSTSLDATVSMQIGVAGSSFLFQSMISIFAAQGEQVISSRWGTESGVKVMDLLTGKKVRLPQMLDFRPRPCGSISADSNNGNSAVLVNPELEVEWMNAMLLQIVSSTRETLVLDITYPRAAPVMMTGFQTRMQTMVLGTPDLPGSMSLSLGYKGQPALSMMFGPFSTVVSATPDAFQRGTVGETGKKAGRGTIRLELDSTGLGALMDAVLSRDQSQFCVNSTLTWKGPPSAETPFRTEVDLPVPIAEIRQAVADKGILQQFNEIGGSSTDGAPERKEKKGGMTMEDYMKIESVQTTGTPPDVTTTITATGKNPSLLPISLHDLHLDVYTTSHGGAPLGTASLLHRVNLPAKGSATIVIQITVNKEGIKNLDMDSVKKLAEGDVPTMYGRGGRLVFGIDNFVTTVNFDLGKLPELGGGARMGGMMGNLGSAVGGSDDDDEWGSHLAKALHNSHKALGSSPEAHVSRVKTHAHGANKHNDQRMNGKSDGAPCSSMIKSPLNPAPKFSWAYMRICPA